MNLRRLFSSIALFGFRHWKVNAILVTCLAGLAYPLLRGIQFESVIPGLESARDAQSRFFAANMERFGESGPLIIHLSSGGADRRTVNRFTDRLAEEIRSWEDIQYVDAKIYDENSRRLQAVMLRAALANMDDESAGVFKAKFSAEGMERELRRTRKRLIAADDPSLREQVAADVLNIGEVIRPYFQSRTGGLNLDTASEYFDAAGHDSRLLFVQPFGGADDADFCTALIGRIDSFLLDLKAALPEAAPIRILFAGRYAISAEAARFLKQEMQRITLLATGLLLVLIWFAFRRIRTVAICFIPLTVSILAVTLIARLFFSPLSYIAISFAAVIIGLGIDLMIHCAARFFQLMETAASPLEAVRQTLMDCGPPLLIGFSTTAAAFACLAVSEYRSTVQFGLLTSIGLIVSLVVSLLLFPTVVRLMGPRSRKDFRPLRFRGFPERAYTFSLSRPGIAVGLAGLLVIAGILFARRFSFEMNLLKLIPQNIKALDTAREIERLYGASFTLNLQLVIQGDDLHKTLAAQEVLDRRLASLAESNEIVSFEPPSLFFPYQVDGQKDRVSPRRDYAFVAENRALFFALLRRYGFKPDPGYDDYYGLVENAARQETLSVGQLLDDEDVGSRLRRHVAFEDTAVFLQTYVWPKNDLFDQAVIQEVFDEFEDLPLPAGITLHKLSILKVFDNINSRARSEFIRVSGLAFAVVVLLILVYFRQASSALLCLLPIAATIPVTLGYIVLTRIPFTPAEIGTAALILGIGIDDAVHIVSRTRLQEKRRMRDVITEIGPVLTLTSLTTMAGFGSLMIARNIVTFTLGAVITFGILACLIFTLLIIPAVHKIMKKD